MSTSPAGTEPAARLRGSCLCGAVVFTLAPPVLGMHHCHCPLCRRLHGSAQATHCRFPAQALELAGDTADALASFEGPDGFRRTFCRRCGSKLFALRAAGDVWVAAGALDDVPGCLPSHHAYTAAGAAWHTIDDALPCYTGATADDAP